MLTVRWETVIRRRPDVVFLAAAEPENQLHWDATGMRSVEKLTEGPLARGSRYRGRWRRWGTIEYTFAEYDPPRRFTHDARMKLGRALHTLDFVADDGGTRLVQELRLSEPNGLGRALGPVLRPLVRRRMADIGNQLKAYVEAERD